MTTNKVINYVKPDILLQKINECDTFSEFSEIFETYNVNTQHPYFLNQLFGNTDHYIASIDHMLIEYNTSAYTYEISPVFTLMEIEIVKKMLSKVGYVGGDGFFCSGGSISNLYGMFLARHNFNNTIKSDGNICNLIGYVSDHAHYSFTKNANLMGIGENNIIKISTINGKMDIVDLENNIKHKRPFFVNATIGTTVLGSFDDIVEIHHICKKYDIWLHIDACFGGAMLYIDDNLLRSIQLSDSISWNFHKVLGFNMQCSLFMTKHKNILKESTYLNINYLFNEENRMYDEEYDIGRKTLFCGRKADAAKLYIADAILTESYFIDKVHFLISKRNQLVNDLTALHSFKLVTIPEYLNVCFWFNPENLAEKKLSDFTVKIRQQMINRGNVMIGIHTVKLNGTNLPYFFRVVVINNIESSHIIKELYECYYSLQQHTY